MKANKQRKSCQFLTPRYPLPPSCLHIINTVSVTLAPSFTKPIETDQRINWKATYQLAFHCMRKELQDLSCLILIPTIRRLYNQHFLT